MVTPELQERLQLLTQVQLENLAEVLLNFSEVGDLEAWLQQISAEAN